ncbi:MAG: membrane protein insertase YidC [Caldiserica bacterium]|nr:membrane protein insertase YidC [Caldisericota bacterium]
MDKKTLYIFLLLFFFLLLIQYSSRLNPPKQEKQPEKAVVSVVSPLGKEADIKSSHRTSLVEDWGRLEVSSWGGVSSCRLRDFKERDYALTTLAEEEKKLKASYPRLSQQEKAIASYRLAKLEKSYKYFENYAGKEVELVSFPEVFWAHLPPYFTYTDPRGIPLISDSARSPYKIKKQGKKIILEREVEGITIIKEFSPSSSPYLVNCRIQLKSSSSLPPGNVRVSVGPDVGYREGGRTYAYEGPVAYIDGKYQKVTFSRREKGKKSEIVKYGKVDWVAIQNTYFTQILLPKDSEIAWFSKNEYDEYLSGIQWEVPVESKKNSRSFEFSLYFGPKKIEPLRTLGKNAEFIVDLGYFGNLFRIIYVLKALYRLTHNYGWAIVLLTIMVNLVLLPLSLKSFHSMKAMQKLHPQVEELKKKLRDNPQKLNKEIMELYRKRGVSPLGGCLPMVFQMPVFFALFTTLRSAIELRGAPFIWWIKDLSLPDTLFVLKGFPIHILPILMGGATLLQQRLTGSEAQNPMMSSFMPIFLLFIFYNFPSGLVLYWFVNSILSIIQQVWVLKFSSISSS